HGLFTHGFPNCFLMGMTQTGLTPNYPHGLDEQASHIAHVIKHAKDSNNSRIEATQEAEDEWVQQVIAKARLGARFFAECTPGYYNNEGKPGSGKTFADNTYGGGPIEFFSILKKWREEGELKGLEVS
ncbi:MAG: hypothetical protein JKY67_02120, partial [Pseudomonadales bacterium]|nr:hypothetical protein [Pseudomonadales bacterium]